MIIILYISVLLLLIYGAFSTIKELKTVTEASPSYIAHSTSDTLVKYKSVKREDILWLIGIGVLITIVGVIIYSVNAVAANQKETFYTVNADNQVYYSNNSAETVAGQQKAQKKIIKFNEDLTSNNYWCNNLMLWPLVSCIDSDVEFILLADKLE